MNARYLGLWLLVGFILGCGGDDTSPLDSAPDTGAMDDTSAPDARPDGAEDAAASDGSIDAGAVTCESAPAVDTSWSGGSLLYCGFGTAACGATATPDGPCLCTQEWSDNTTSTHCGGAVVSPDGSHTYLAWCNPQTGICRCSFDGDECYCRARPARACSDVCGPDSRGCLCDTFPDGTPRNLCADECPDSPGLVECCADPTASDCTCWGGPRSDTCQRSLNCCWTGGNAI